MAQLQQTSITGSIASTGSLIISGSEPVQLPLLSSGSGEVDLTGAYQLWFDRGDLNVKYHVKGSQILPGAWSAIPPLMTARAQGGGFGENASSGVISGGEAPSVSDATEEWNGKNWSAGGNLITGRFESTDSGAGTTTAGLVIGGSTPSKISCTEEYNGTVFAAGGALITARMLGGSSGTQNAALHYGGATPSVVTCNEEYNGTSWSAGGALSQGRYILGGAGIQNSTTAVGGYTPTVVACVEHYNGSAWSTGTDLPSARFGSATTGECEYSIFTSGGATPTLLTSALHYDGTTWGFDSNKNNASREAGKFGTAFNRISGGNKTPSASGVSEQYISNYVPPFTCNLPQAWSTSGTLITARCDLAGAGTQNAALGFGGNGCKTCTEEYNGTSWSPGGALITGRYSLAGAGTQNAGVAFGGYASPGANTNSTEEYDGTSWSPGGALINSRRAHAGFGTQNAALAAGGEPSTLTATEEYNGSTWATGGNMIVGRDGVVGAGTQNAGVVYGGSEPSLSNKTEEYDGSSWSASGTLITARLQISKGFGTQNAAVAAGGSTGSETCLACVENYDGSTWSAGPNLPQKVRTAGAAGTSNAGLVFGGAIAHPAVTDITQELTGTEVNLATYKCYLANSSWSAGGNMITGRHLFGSGGSPTAAIANAGSGPGNPAGSALTEEYNGTSWATGGTMPFGSEFGQTNGGSQNSFASANFSPQTRCHIEYNGSSWSDSGATLINNTFGRQGNTLDKDSLVSIGGYSPNEDNAEEYNGSSWSEGGNLITARGLGFTGGTQNAHIYAGGWNGSSTQDIVESYNGTAFSALTALPVVKRSGGGFGSQNDFIVTGGISSEIVCTTYWNGTTWSGASNLPETKCYHGATNNQATADGGLVFGGHPGSVSTYHWGGCTCAFSNLHCKTRCLSATCTQI